MALERLDGCAGGQQGQPGVVHSALNRMNAGSMFFRRVSAVTVEV